MHINSSVLLIGSGRLARHLQHWNSLLEKPNSILTWDRSQSTEKLNAALNKCNIVWLAISDSAIVEFYESYLLNSGKTVVHFSGALNDARILSAHPLMSFPKDFLPSEVYSQIHFVISGFDLLHRALPQFNNAFSSVSSNNKALYHALCVLSGNFPQLLWNDVSEQMHKLDIPEKAFDLYIEQIAQSYLKYKKNALTGPIIRNDQKTISDNLQSLTENSKLRNIYSAFNKEFNK
ncbi:DUF2520 domain-containing protein [bacterium]|nr:DUF2520 domain-containing protein [bacterium]